MNPIWRAYFSNRSVQPPGRITSDHSSLTLQLMLLCNWNPTEAFFGYQVILFEIFFTFFFLPYFRYSEVDRFSRILENNSLLLIEGVSDRVSANFLGSCSNWSRSSTRRQKKQQPPMARATRSIQTNRLGAKDSPRIHTGATSSRPVSHYMSPCYMRKRKRQRRPIWTIAACGRFPKLNMSCASWPPGGEVAREAATLGSWHECWYWLMVQKSGFFSWCDRQIPSLKLT